MLELIRAAPLLFGLVSIGASALVGGAGWIGRGWIFDTFERPAIERAAADACARRVEQAAAQAKAEEQERQRRVAAAATEAAAQDEAAARALLEARSAQLAGRVGEYVGERIAGGRACPLDRADVDFLGGLPDHGQPN